jgi:hypothetical protein
MMKFLGMLNWKTSSLTKYPMRHWKLQEGMRSQGITHSRPVPACLFAQADQSN